MKKAFLFISIVLLFCTCTEVEEPEPVDKLVFQSLIVMQDTLIPGENTTIKAIATGSNLEYFWSASKGDILGSGAEVIYASRPCHLGTNTISCKVTNGDKQSETKSATIVVLE